MNGEHPAGAWADETGTPLADDEAAWIAQHLAAHAVGTLGTAVDGQPHVTMMYFSELPDFRLTFVMRPESRKGQNVQHVPRVAYLVDSREVLPDNPRNLGRVECCGALRFVESETPEHAALVERFLAKTPEAAAFVKPTNLLAVLETEEIRFTPGSSAPVRSVYRQLTPTGPGR